MTYETYRSRGYVPELDGIRALCILAVITAHVPLATMDPIEGRLGVHVFFVLSGYLITSLALREEEKSGRLHLRAFFIRRVFRLFPAYYVVLAAYAIPILVLGIEPTKRDSMAAAMPYYLTYLQEWFVFGKADPLNMQFGQSWSLGFEEKFYLLWPLIGFVWLKGRTRARLAAALAVVVLCTAARFFVMEGKYVLYYGMIMVGCAVAIVLQERAWFERLRWMGQPRVLAATLALWLGMHALVHFAFDPSRHMHLEMLYAGVVGIFLLSLLLQSSGGLHRVLAWRPLVYIGTISYGIYLVHMLALKALKMALPANLPGLGLALLLGGTMLSIASAEVLARTVERPLREYGRRLAARYGPAHAAKVRQPEPVVATLGS